MDSIGITKDQFVFKWAVIRKHDRCLVIEKLEMSSFVKADVLSTNSPTIVTGLEEDAVLRRDLRLPLNTHKTLRKALPFQIESLLPFPIQESVVFPQYSYEGKETLVTIWATTKEKLSMHLSKWQGDGIDPDYVSSQVLALGRWALFFFSHQSQLFFVHKNLAVVLDRGHIACAVYSPDLARLKLFLQQKYPLFQQIESGPSVNGWSPEELWQFAIEIGLALEPFEKYPCQLRTPAFASIGQKKKERDLLKFFLCAALATILLTIGVGKAIFHFQEKKLKTQIPSYQTHAKGSLEEVVRGLSQRLLHESKNIPPLPNLPTTQEVLSWLSTLQTCADIHHFEYQLIDYPKEKSKTTPYRALITIEFQVPSSAEADQLIKQLRQSPSFVEPTHELKWTTCSQGYKISFPLRKSF